MRLQWLLPGLIALALGAVPPRFARAATETSSTAVLGLESIDAPTTLADEISEELRQRVSTSRELTLVSGKDLVEVKLVFACADEAASCMAQAGKSLDAQKLIYGSIKRAGDDFAVWLKMFDVRRGKIDFWVTETLPKKSADSAGIKAATARWFAKLLGRAPVTGTVQVTSNLRGAAVSLDGALLGVTAEQPLTIPDVAAGKHELVLSKSGHATAKQQVTVGAGQTLPVNVTLHVLDAPTPTSPIAGQAHAQATDPETHRSVGLAPSAAVATAPSTAADTVDGRDGYRTGFWVTLAAGVASTAAAVKFGLDVGDVNKKLDPFRRFPCMGGQLCDAKGVVRPPLTAAERNRVGSLNDEGSRDQTLQWICIGVGSALGVASGYLLYKGYIDTEDAPAQHQAQHGLRVFPTAGTTSSGIVAEFDF